MNPSPLSRATEIPPGRWAVAVSGGADSVALLLLLHGGPGISLHVVHLDHQTRGQASTDDAGFVAMLAGKLAIPATIVRRDQIEPGMGPLPKIPQPGIGRSGSSFSAGLSTKRSLTVSSSPIRPTIRRKRFSFDCFAAQAPWAWRE